MNGLVVKQNMETFAADADDAENTSGFNVRFECDGIDKVPESTLHHVDGAVEGILGRLAGDARLDEEGGDCEG